MDRDGAIRRILHAHRATRANVMQSSESGAVRAEVLALEEGIVGLQGMVRVVGAAVLLAFALLLVGVAKSPLQGVPVDKIGQFWLMVVGQIGIFVTLFYVFGVMRWRQLPGLTGISAVITLALFATLPPFEGFKPDILARAAPLMLGIGGTATGWLVYLWRCGTQPQRLQARTLLWASALMGAYALLFDSFLDLTAALHPATFDAAAFRFDATLGFQASAELARLGERWPWFRALLLAAYTALPFGFAVVYAVQVRQGNRAPLDFARLWLVSALAAYIAYHLLPVAGPRYAFGEAFPANLPQTLGVTSAVIAPAPRNGVPSMHLGWALAMFLSAWLSGIPWMRLLFGALLALTALATLGLGEHYLVDLAAALPFMLASTAAVYRGLPTDDAVRRRALLAGGSLFVAWLAALRWGIEIFEAVPGLSWALVLSTVVVVARHFARLLQTGAPVEKGTAIPAQGEASEPGWRGFGRLGVVFFISGFAGLMYEVFFAKKLALVFGGTALATHTVLAVYMGGMALGAWLGGRVAQRARNPLVLYALCELAIAGYCAVTPVVFEQVRALYVATAGGFAPDDPFLMGLRILLGGGAMSVPTVLMGMTLPLLARHLEAHSVSLGQNVSLLYAANTLGAGLGALLAGYLIIPALGMGRTLMLAVFMNLVAALLALEVFKRQKGGAAAPAADEEALPVPGEAMHAARTALIILSLGGVVTLALETHYIHMLGTVAGNSAYAFSLMLFAFLMGLGLGADAGRRLLRRGWSLLGMVGTLQLLLAAVILGGVFGWSQMPGYFADYAQYPAVREFGAREFVRGVVCVLVMFPPAALIGASYPIAIECVGRAFPARRMLWLGRAAALNTLGNILGVVLGGFVMLPVLGALHSIQFAAATSALLGVLALARAGASGAHRLRWAVVAPVIVLALTQPRELDLDRVATGANVYFARQDFGAIVDHAESLDGGITAVAHRPVDGSPRPLLTLLTNGKFQGNNSLAGEMRAQVGFALAPLLHTTRRDDALVIGYGTGVSARTLKDAGFRNLDVVELSGDIIDLANRHFADVNGSVTSRPGVSTFVTDGRNFLLLQPRRYDLIGMEVSSIWFAGSGALYNREFYALAKQRLKPEGVLQQWVQLHHITSLDLMRVLASVRSEFRTVHLYLLGGQGIIVATDSETSVPVTRALDRLRAEPAIMATLREVDLDVAEVERARLVMPQQVDRAIAALGIPVAQLVSSDDNMALEYSTPRGNALDSARSFASNVAFLRGLGAPEVALDQPAAGGIRVARSETDLRE